MLRAAARLAPNSLAPRLPVAALGPAGARWHCQVPCGIFDDPVRVTLLKEDASTVRKAMGQITELAAKGDGLSVNQATRWVVAKEEAASNIITAVSEYMLCQRVKKELFETSEEYAQALVAHHALLTSAVKTKQVPAPSLLPPEPAVLTAWWPPGGRRGGVRRSRRRDRRGR